MWTLGTAAKSKYDEENEANGNRKSIATKRSQCVAGREGRGVKLKRWGSLKKNSVAVMLRDGPCFLHDKLPGRGNTFEEWQKREDGWNKIRAGRKDVRGIEKGTKSVK